MFFNDFTNHRKKTNRAVVFNCRPFPNILKYRDPKIELDVVVPAKPIFYKCNVNGTYVWKKKNDVEKLFEELNSHNENIKLTLEVNPTKFLDTELVRENGEITMQVFSSHKSYMCTGVQKFLWYKHNAVTGELNRAKWTAFDFNKELKRIRQR